MRRHSAIGALVGCFIAFAFLGATHARDIHVDHEKGDDADASGRRPLKTIAKAVSLAQPGDTIHLAPTKTPYKESAVFHNKSGEAGRPIILDGHGATLSGSEPLAPEEWKEVSRGLHRNDKLINANDAIIMRWYFVFDGKMNHMGRTSKGPKQPLKKPDELQAGEWTFVKEENAFYIRIDPKKKLADYNIEAPLRSNGVGFGGDCNHIIIRNLVATHVWNDGYNIHGKTRDILFANVTAIDCGDDGLSAHEDCEIRVDGFVSIGNSTGMCNIGNSTSASNRVLIKGCYAYDFSMLGTNTHTLTNSIIYADADRNIAVGGGSKPEEICTVRMDNVVVINRRKEPKPISVQKNAVFEGKRMTIYGLGFDVSGVSAALLDSVIGGEPTPEIVVHSPAKWTADKNLYDLKQLRMDNTTYTAKDFDACRHATHQDATSKWTKVEFGQPVNGQIKAPRLGKETGADLSLIPSEDEKKGRKKRGK